MKRLLKYLLPVMILAAFGNHADESVRMVSEVASADMALNDAEVCQSCISAQETEFCAPRQVSVANAPRVQSAPRRTGGLHRCNVEFVKAGRVINAGVRYLQNTYIVVSSAHSEPAHRLILIGKLII